MLIKFLSQNGPRDPKHSSSWLHPVSVFLLHYVTITILTIIVHDTFIPPTTRETLSSLQQEQQSHQQRQIALVTFVYFCTLILYRIIIHRDNKIIQKGIVYESTWLCNSTLYMATIGLCSQRYILVLSHAVVVSIDQVLWYVDLIGWVFR